MIIQSIRDDYHKAWERFLNDLMSFQERQLPRAIAEENIHDYLCSIQYVPNYHLKKINEQIGYHVEFIFNYMMYYAVAQSIKSKVPDVEYASVTKDKTIRLSYNSELIMFKNGNNVTFKFEHKISLQSLRLAEWNRDYLFPHGFKYYLIGASAHVKFDDIEMFSNHQIVAFLRSSYMDRVRSKRVDELVDDACKFLNSG
ncbi:hypothetical protein JNL27_11465 [bacterium]|nr:hypothetical protein [bacterium]